VTPKIQDTAKAKSGLTVKQQALVDAYDGDAKAAAKAAGMSYGYARILLTKHNKVREAIRNRQDTEVRPPNIATRQERQKFWTETMNSEEAAMRDRLRASELLGRSEADFTENVSHRFPEGCGVMVVGAPYDHDEFSKAAGEHFKNGKNGKDAKDGKDKKRATGGDSKPVGRVDRG